VCGRLIALLARFCRWLAGWLAGWLGGWVCGVPFLWPVFSQIFWNSKSTSVSSFVSSSTCVALQWSSTVSGQDSCALVCAGA
jgi:hypothetical protein